MVLGMIPDCDLAEGGLGRQRRRHRRAHRAAEQRLAHEIEELVRRIEKIETAIEPKFQEHFVAAMGIPHSTAANPWLSKVVKLPQQKAAAPRAGAEAGAGARRPERRPA